MNSPSPFIEVFEPQIMPNGEYAASAHVHLGPEGSVRIVATAPQAVAAKAMAHAQAFVSKHLGHGVRPGVPPFMPPPIPARPAPANPAAPFAPVAVPPAIPPGIMPAPLTRTGMAQARALLRQAASVPLAAETARAARRFVPILRPLRDSVYTPGQVDLAQLFERAAMLLEAAEREPEARERLAEAVRRARRDGRLLRVLQAVRAAERAEGPAGVDALKRLAGAASLLGRAETGDGQALAQIQTVLQGVMGGASAPRSAEPSAARAAGYLSVADAELVQPAASEVGAAARGGHDDDPALLELVRALRGMRAGFRRAAR